ncbi:hypothetical protein [Polynucleobacter nymphae]|uniref:hypothetical protein n=1 Tax=Polynucleobacter nymphae TaxID=2081043 RepID=UPI001C0BF618|nr:hypothetical protein [Polynucleobacter nymphae]MBU3606862.1 hypothetical protein [Polynucleobacter nymphae]
MKKIVLLIFTLITIQATAGTIDLSCSGVMGGQRILEESYQFDIAVNDKNGAMSLPQTPTGCYSFEGSTIPLKFSCSIDNVNAYCSCESFWGKSYITLSRSTASLTISKIWKDGDTSKGIFKCNRITKKVF